MSEKKTKEQELFERVNHQMSWIPQWEVKELLEEIQKERKHEQKTMKLLAEENGSLTSRVEALVREKDDYIKEVAFLNKLAAAHEEEIETLKNQARADDEKPTIDMVALNIARKLASLNLCQPHKEKVRRSSTEDLTRILGEQHRYCLFCWQNSAKRIEGILADNGLLPEGCDIPTAVGRLVDNYIEAVQKIHEFDKLRFALNTEEGKEAMLQLLEMAPPAEGADAKDQGQAEAIWSAGYKKAEEDLTGVLQELRDTISNQSQRIAEMGKELTAEAQRANDATHALDQAIAKNAALEHTIDALNAKLQKADERIRALMVEAGAAEVLTIISKALDDFKKPISKDTNPAKGGEEATHEREEQKLQPSPA
jgi:hypothetical protein